MRFCDKTNTTVELYALNAKAQSASKGLVGVTKQGDLFTVVGKEHHKISVEAAAEILETTVAEVQKFLDARGDYQIKDPEPAPIPSPEPIQGTTSIPQLSTMPKQPIVPPMPEVVPPKAADPEMTSDPNPARHDPDDPINAAAAIVAKAVGDVLAEHEIHREEQLERIEAKIDKLKEAVDKLQEVVENFYL